MPDHAGRHPAPGVLADPDRKQWLARRPSPHGRYLASHEYEPGQGRPWRGTCARRQAACHRASPPCQADPVPGTPDPPSVLSACIGSGLPMTSRSGWSVAPLSMLSKPWAFSALSMRGRHGPDDL